MRAYFTQYYNTCKKVFFGGILRCYSIKLICYNYFTTYAVKINVYSFISFRSLRNTINGAVMKIKLIIYVRGCRPSKQRCNGTHYLPYNSKYSAFCPRCFYVRVLFSEQTENVASNSINLLVLVTQMYLFVLDLLNV